MTNWDKLPVIDTNNINDFIDPVVDGVRMLSARTAPDMSVMEAPKLVRIPVMSKAEMKERIAERKAKKAEMRDFMDYMKIPIKNQKQTPLCWMFAVTTLIETTRALQGQKFVSLSPGSGAALVTNYTLRGGYGGEAVDICHSDGLVPSFMWADTSVSRQLDTPATREIRKQYRSDEFGRLPTGDMDMAASFILQYGIIAAGVNSMRHELPYADVDFDSRGRMIFKYPNSWSVNWGDRGWGAITEDAGRGDFVFLMSAIPSN